MNVAVIQSWCCQWNNIYANSTDVIIQQEYLKLGNLIQDHIKTCQHIRKHKYLEMVHDTITYISSSSIKPYDSIKIPRNRDKDEEDIHDNLNETWDNTSHVAERDKYPMGKNNNFSVTLMSEADIFDRPYYKENTELQGLTIGWKFS